jgi:hypothetical protein
VLRENIREKIMYRVLILEYAPKLLLVIFAISATIKWLKISSLKHTDNYTELFLRSFLPFSRDEIKNAYHESVKKFYRANNKANNLFYISVLGVGVLYALMWAIS